MCNIYWCYQALINKTKNELMVETENTSLKTENEQLKLLLTEYQLNGMLKH